MRCPGLPKASTSADDDSWNAMNYLKVLLEDVKAAFERYGLLDDQVHFHEGYFRDSLPRLRKAIMSAGGAIALLRMGAIELFCIHSFMHLQACYVATGPDAKLERVVPWPDGDMFESTMDILFNLADLLSPGACIVVDDW